MFAAPMPYFCRHCLLGGLQMDSPKDQTCSSCLKSLYTDYLQLPDLDAEAAYDSTLSCPRDTMSLGQRPPPEA